MTKGETGREMMRQLLLNQAEVQLEFMDKALNTVIARAELEEREACAKIAKDAINNKFGMDRGTCEWIELAIRGRK